MQVAIKRACTHPAAKQVVLTQHADDIMDALLKLQSARDAINDEAVLAMSVLCIEQGREFARYLQHIMPGLLVGLSRHEDLQVCLVFCFCIVSSSSSISLVFRRLLCAAHVRGAGRHAVAWRLCGPGPHEAGLVVCFGSVPPRGRTSCVAAGA